MRNLFIAAFAVAIIASAHADTAKLMATTVVDLDAATLTAAPWLNQAHFIVIRTAGDPALKWIEKITGKSFAASLTKHPLLVYNGYEGARFFTSGEGAERALLLDVPSLKQRDPFSTAVSIAVAELPADAKKLFWINRVAEDTARLGGSSGSGLGGGSTPKK